MFSRVAKRSLRPSITRDYYRKWCYHCAQSNDYGPRTPDFPCPRLFSLRRPFVFEEQRLLENTTFVRKFSSQPEIYQETTPEKSVEEQYNKKTPLEHVLLRPGMYVGPVERLPTNYCWVLDPTPKGYNFSSGGRNESMDSSEEQYRIAQKECGLIPALIKVFDEILVNASDNRLRHPKTCTLLDVRIDPGAPDRDPCIRIWNNGKGIPVQVHKEEGMYVPEMLFGHLLTGSNFDDTEKRLTGGRHGYGAKLTNIFSKSFTVETVDSRRKLHYKQSWNDNMTKTSKAEISNLDDTKADDFTCVTFVPDMARLTGDPLAVAMDEQDYAIMCRRVLDAAGCAAGKLRVALNGQDVSMESFAEYSQMYRKEDSSALVFNTINSRWEIGIGLSENHSFDSISFVNGMSTPRGGTHVNAIVNQVVKRIQEKAIKSDPELASLLTPGLIKRHLFICCNALIENPTFDSQMKEFLTSSPSSFGSSYNLSETFLNEIVKSEESGGSGIIEEILRVAKGRQQANLFKQVGGKKSKRHLLSIPKLEDAHGAGSEASPNCTLILTEGDSAKALAVAGLEVIGRKSFGVFPLRGKFLNVRHASVDQLANNGEVKALIAILGLVFDKEYDTAEERAELRYGKIMLMTDQDTDGSHIKGLVINFFRHFWPKLLKPAVDDPLCDPFMSSFFTPLLKVANKKRKETHSFYSMADYNAWRSSFDNAEEMKHWRIKYYKGLGTSTPAEAKEYFSDFDKHHRPFHWNSELDGELLDKVFDKERAADRRDWISDEYDPEAAISFDDTETLITYEDFVNKEMIHFSHADNIRSIPSSIDGFKPSQRKVLFSCFKRKLKSEIKVAQLSGYCAEHTAYHHGEASLQGTIVGMAQDFVGSNNLNLLVPSGQFGTRLAGGKDAASPRYIYTQLSPIARRLFPEDDDALLEYLEDDGQMIEPRFFCPIIPLLLVNGTQGIGTGWSSFIPPHNPMSVLDYIRAKLEMQLQLPKIEPFANGFKGSIERRPDGSGYVTYGKVKEVNKKTVLISELPVGVWTEKYKSRLLKMQSKGLISNIVEDHTTTKVSFKVTLKAGQLSRMKQIGLEKAFNLTTNMRLTNMHAFSAQGKMQKFSSAESIADSYFPVRLSLYDDRKSVLQSKLEHLSTTTRNKARFIELVSQGKIDLLSGKVSKDESQVLLQRLDFNTAHELEKVRNNNSIYRKGGQGRKDENEEKSSGGGDYDYLFKMPLSSLTKEKIEELTLDAQKADANLKDLQQLEPKELWLSDLDKLAAHL